MATSAPEMPARVRAATAAVLVAVLAALEVWTAPRPMVQLASDLLQLALALSATALCFRAAARARDLARAFWGLVGLGTLTWSAAQGHWTVTQNALDVLSSRLDASDVLFLACAAPLFLAFALRPDRPRTTALGLAFDLALLLVLALHAFVYFALPYHNMGSQAAYRVYLSALYNVANLLVLASVGWALHAARPPWRPLYRELAVALLLFHGGTSLSDIALTEGTYHPGLHDIPWTIPFAWIGLAALRPSPGRDEAVSEESMLAAEWRDTRRGTVLALLAVVLVPSLHFAASTLLRGAELSPTVTELRTEVSVGTTIVLGSLFLLRQLRLLRQAETTRAQREQGLRLLFAANPHPMWVVERETLRILEVNTAAIAVYGYSREELLAKRISELGADATPGAERGSSDVAAPLDSYRRAGEWRQRCRDGRVLEVEVASQELDFSGRGAVLIAAYDVSEAREARRERERLIAELERRNAELERFTYTVSHDLRSPLVTVKGFLGAVEAAARNGNTEQVHEDIARIRAAADRMDRLLKELLDLSRVGRVARAPQDVSLAQLVDEASVLVAGRLSQRGVRLEVQPGLPTLRGDRERLLEVVQNLLDNAVKFMGDQPSPCIEVGVREGHGQEIIFVRDNGIGIDPRHHEKVFGLFERLDPSIEGTGVGLALVRRIVEVHGGRIWVESEGSGRGSCLCLTLPIAARPGDARLGTNDTATRSRAPRDS